MSVNFLFVIFGGIVLSLVDNARILPRVKRQSLKVRITAKDDSIVLQYLSTSPVIKLQGYVLGLGGRFSRQNITLPGNGDPIEVDVDFNPKYLVAVHPVAEQNNAALGKKCKGIPDLHKPPQISIDPRTPTSVYLTWANGFKDKGYKVGKECENERQYTVRYREKERDKKWKYHLCPTSETTIDNLKPNTVYEFGIRVTKAKEDGVWSKPTIYTTTMNPQPRSTKNDQKEEKLNKIEVNFNSENPKHPRKSELPGMTNIKGMTAVKQLGAPSSAHNRTNLKLLPKKPELSTKAVVGGQSTSNNADIHPEKSSSPKPAITRKPEHTRDELLDKEGIKEETTNTVSKPSLKGSKTRKENEKPAMKPLTTKESKLSSSVSPSFPSKPLFNSDRTEIQLPGFLTPSTASELDTLDKFTEPETPSPTIMPFIALRTTSDHADVGNQDLPDRKLTNSDTYAFSTAPISERGNIEDQEFKALKPTNSETSHAFSSTPKSELDNKEDKEITDYEQPTSGTPNMVSETQESALDNKDLAESDPPSDSSSIITSNPMHKIDAKQDHTGPETPSTVAQFPSAISGSTQESSPVFRSTPVSNIDGQGQERFRGPHVKYMTKINMPCSITESLKHFQEENITNAKALTAPRYPPSNLTLVTVEGCPTFLIVDWMNNENDTASEYEVVSQMQGPDNKTEKLITITNQTHAAVENLKPNTSYTFSVTPTNIHGRGPSSEPLPFVTESADPSVSEYIPGKDAIWTQYSFKFDSYSECQGKRFVKRTRYRKFVGIVLCNSLRYKIYLSNSLSGIFYNIGDLSGHGEDHCQFVDSFLDGRTGEHLLPEQLPIRQGFYRSVRQEPVMFGTIGGQTHINYVHWYECGIAIPGQW
ncbi:target of Nesh-SH3-like isoform X2 [Pristis pectinata]|uniref:target of Nesh-SH3-like isoform X2 n=1 Tax=Pristis pectinata TaxID=685728 RepID=UPI00223D596F|nr:target of Nesh-SH3-like isoform X2 [Pristis pectinata]